MKLANLSGRLVLVQGETALDVESASSGSFSADPQAVYARWDEFVAWAPSADFSGAEPFNADDLDAPVPRPGEIFAIGINYAEHAAEAQHDLPDHPVVFTKFLSSLASAMATVTLPSENVDYEVELVVVIGKTASNVSVDSAWDYVAGLTVGQDISERVVQRRGPAPQFSLGKSYPNFAPTGPVVVTVDEFADPTALNLTTVVENGESSIVKQAGNTRDMIFSVAEIISRLSNVITFEPGDIIFTGTPSGVGMGMTPPVFLKKGETLISTIEGIGTMRNPLR